MNRDLIVAPATPRGRGALAVVRLSGRELGALIPALVRPLSGAALTPGRPRRVALVDAEGVYDDGVLLFSEGPATYTGEDTAEITCHGNPLVVDRLVGAALAAGARLADPGEFTQRALLSGKLDLLGAEAVHQVVEATSWQGLAVARQGADGSLGAFAESLREALLGVGAELEARLDHPEEDLSYQSEAELLGTLSSLSEQARALAQTWEVGRVRLHGARVALVGPVNAGKSSLFNALLGRRRALVHPTPGTTRDVIEAATELGGLQLVLLDTAGERRTSDPVEAAGLALARELVEEADLLLVVVPAGPGALDSVSADILARTSGRPRLVVYNGVDRDGAGSLDGALPTSALTGEGIGALREAVGAVLTQRASRAEGLVLGSARQRDRFLAVAREADEASAAFALAGEAAAADAVIRAVEELDALTGADSREAVRDALFARFCVGK
ncbi:MAG: 50S ribosome-binding GTPase [Deltaproteobacteria bacterium]|nr:50S ribosome-binding GTPase [Deltaproteobacteria bacterium]